MKFKTGARGPGRGLLFHSGTCLSVGVRRALCALSFDRSGWKDERAAKRDPATKKKKEEVTQLGIRSGWPRWRGGGLEGALHLANETLTESEMQSQEAGKTNETTGGRVCLTFRLCVFLSLTSGFLPHKTLHSGRFPLTPDRVAYSLPVKHCENGECTRVSF